MSSINDPKSNLSRRDFIAMLSAGSAAALLPGYAPGLSVRSHRPASIIDPGKIAFSMSPDEALQRLLDGNKRYAAAKAEHPDQTADRRVEVAKGQNPFAIILGCIDSRVPPEIVFDQGLGDLFVIRTAAGVLADVVTGSIEFGVAEFGVPLVLVLGHERCGAVKATIDALEKHAEAEGHIGSIVSAIKPAVDKAKAMSGDLLDNTVTVNAALIAEQLEATTPILEEAYKANKLRIVAARYDLDDGIVKLLG
jgi:carbonic anhydrase